MPPKEKPAGSTLDPFETLVWYLFIALLVGAILTKLFMTGSGSYGGFFQTIWLGFKAFFLAHIFPILYILAIIASALFAVGIVMALKQETAARKAMDDFYHPPVLKEHDETALIEEPKNPKWERVMNHLNSTNQNDWKFAIIEADIMLSDLLEVMQYEGDTVADRLKKVEASDFTTIEEAWEAHKVRNQIAHEGAEFVLSEREARRVIELYKKVFSEFKII